MFYAYLSCMFPTFLPQLLCFIVCGVPPHPRVRCSLGVLCWCAGCRICMCTSCASRGTGVFPLGVRGCLETSATCNAAHVIFSSDVRSRGVAVVAAAWRFTSITCYRCTNPLLGFSGRPGPACTRGERGGRSHRLLFHKERWIGKWFIHD